MLTSYAFIEWPVLLIVWHNLYINTNTCNINTIVSSLLLWYRCTLSSVEEYPCLALKRAGPARLQYRCAPLAEWFVLEPCVVSLEESPGSSHSCPAELCISFVGVKWFTERSRQPTNCSQHHWINKVPVGYSSSAPPSEGQCNQTTSTASSY